MLRSTILTLFVTLIAPAMAAEPSYNYIEAGYQKVEVDVGGGLNVDGDGYGVGGSFEVGDSFHVFGGYSSSNFDFDVDLDEFSLGAGYHAAISNNVDALLEVAYVSAKASAFGVSVDEDGYAASLGVRGFLGDSLELTGSVAYTDIGGSGDTSLGLAGWYYLTPTFALGVNAGFSDDVSAYGTGLRLFFGD